MGVILMGDVFILKNGVHCMYVDMDEDSGWPIAEVPGLGLVPVDPVTIEGWEERDY
jgi:hypothetical protein